MERETNKVHRVICAVCRHIWVDSQDVFYCFCPECESNMVFEYWPEKVKVMGDGYDDKPWY